MTTGRLQKTAGTHSWTHGHGFLDFPKYWYATQVRSSKGTLLKCVPTTVCANFLLMPERHGKTARPSALAGNGSTSLKRPSNISPVSMLRKNTCLGCCVPLIATGISIDQDSRLCKGCLVQPNDYQDPCIQTILLIRSC